MAGKRAARYSTGFALALGIGIGGFFGSAQLASSTPSRSRTVALRRGDAAVFGYVHCAAKSESRTPKPRFEYVSCWKRPSASARYFVDVGPDGIVVWQAGSTTPAYMTPR